jgi:hypothetical protein
MSAIWNLSQEAALGQLPPFDDSSKQSSERLLHSETCLKTDPHNSATAAGGIRAKVVRYAVLSRHRSEIHAETARNYHSIRAM